MDQYEYKTIFTAVTGFTGGNIDKNALERELNALGAQGWELVSTVAAAQGYGSTKWLISVFKRKIL